MKPAAAGVFGMIGLLWTSLVLAQAPAPARAVVFEELDRLYFERVDGSAAGPQVRERIRVVLPSSLAAPAETPTPTEQEEGPGVRDFPLPAPLNGVLRQVLDRSNPRLAEQHWALYTEGRKTDHWFFSPAPAGKDGKALATYEVERVAPAPGRVVFESCGSVFRPEGAWWWEGRNLHFVADGDRLRFDHVVTRFYASGGSELDSQPPLTVYDEREGPDGRIEVRSVDPVTKAAVGACRFPDPFTDAEASCASLERAVRCLAARPEAKTSYRERGMPSFIEKGGRPRGGAP